MKPTTMISKSFSGARGTARAHTPQRHRTAGAHKRYPESRLSASGAHRGYVEAPQAHASSAADSASYLPGMRRVLHVDMDVAGAQLLAGLLAPEAHVTHAGNLAEAQHLLEANVFSLVVLDPALPDGDARLLLPLLAGTPLLVYSAHQPEWRDAPLAFLPKPWTSPRQLWVAISAMLGVPSSFAAGD